jgi:serine/threonine-protein kinase
MQGTQLGPYEILEQLGAGGMGEVWLAQDTRLGRKVAIKILPEQFASDPERLARFEQEARAAAALNHPHIAAVYDVGHENGIHFMVQEHLEGQTLRAAIAEGRLPLAHALKLGLEIAEALKAAHAEGIVHRDLKPENVFVTPDRHAKVLDFGLAKLTEIAIASQDGSASMSPTVLGTVAGQMMGTAGYMAPEQIEGVAVDQRADLFAFGCVLYELGTGQRAFQGKNLVDTLHRVSNVEPDTLLTIDGALPSGLQRILDKALAKDPASRYQTAGDLAVDMRALLGDVETGKATPVALEGASGGGGLSPGIVAAVAVASAVVGALVWWAVGGSAEPTTGRLTHLQFGLVDDNTFTGSGRRPLAISPDGQRVAFTDEGFIRLRELSDPALIEVRGTEDPRGPAFSPDSQSIAFFSDGELRKVPITGGAPIRLADLADNPVGMKWEADGTILVAVPPGQIVRVPDTGGEPEVLVALEQGEVQGPSLLPGGEWLLFCLREVGTNSYSDAQIVAQSLTSGERRVLVAGGTEPRYLDTGHLTFARDGNLLAVPFDATSVEVTGGSVVLVEGFPMASSGGAYYDVSAAGDLLYFSGSGGTRSRRTLGQYDLQGNLQMLPFEPEAIDNPALAPDGNRIAMEHLTAAGDEVWVYEIDRGTRQRLTPAGIDAEHPVWSPDGQWLYVDVDGALHRIRADFSGELEQIGEDRLDIDPRQVSADGLRVVGTVRGSSFDIAIVDLEARTMEVVVGTAALEVSPQLSPDGRFLAYVSNESGDFQVYVRDLETGQRQVASPDGGGTPLWAPDGSALLYLTGSRLTSAAATYGATLSLAAPQELFDMRERSGFPFGDVSMAADGTRMLVMTDNDVSTEESLQPAQLNLVLNWSQVLQQRVPGGR